MAELVTVSDFRTWAGASNVSAPDTVVQQCLDEAEASILADLYVTIDEILSLADATVTARGEELRRAQRLLARRNSPEGIAGAGELGWVAVPSRDPDSSWAVTRLRQQLNVPEGIA